MSIQITAIRLAGGNGHEHISDLWWTSLDTGKSDVSTRAVIVDWIENEKGVAFVEQPAGVRAYVGIYPLNGQKYLRTHSDGKWTDNLLALPRR